MDHRTIVTGAGIVGMARAFEMQRRGNRATLLDGHGAAVARATSIPRLVPG